MRIRVDRFCAVVLTRHGRFHFPSPVAKDAGKKAVAEVTSPSPDCQLLKNKTERLSKKITTTFAHLNMLCFGFACFNEKP